jgi:pimeloyl-ACP methyl ester carboxylesterase
LRREVLYELVQDPDGFWVWRHHPGNLAAAPDEDLAPASDPLWDELAQLEIPVALIRGDRATRPTEADVAAARERVPSLHVLTVPGAGPDLAATQPAALAAALGQLLTAGQVRQ